MLDVGRGKRDGEPGVRAPCAKPSLPPPSRPWTSTSSTSAPALSTAIANTHAFTMLQRSSRRLLPALTRQTALLRPYSTGKNEPVTTSTDNPVPANNPNPEKTQKNFAVSSSNALPSSSFGSHDYALVEPPEEGEAKRVMQAPNREGVWSRSQQPRSKAMVGPRFEQTIMEDQV